MKWFCILLAAMMLFSTMALSEDSTAFRPLQVGDNGEDVVRLKQLLSALGFMGKVKFSTIYTAETAEKVKLFQQSNGLEATGVADVETQALAYRLANVTAPASVSASGTPTAQATKAPLAAASTARTDESGYPADMPARDEKGFLADPDAEEYWFRDEEAGLWLYLSSSLSIEIRRYEDAPAKNVWFECDIQASPESPLKTKVNWSKNGRITVGHEPERCAQENGFVLCLSDDHFGARLHASSRPGVCIRGGEVITDEPYSKAVSSFPNLDVLALLSDGSMRADLCNAYRADDYLAMGAVDTFSFGPVLVSGGQINPLVQSRDYHYVKEPRCALGMIAPYHYFALVVNGRTASGKGVRLDWLANKMLEKGVTEAINLDGGGTASLVFMGQRLNRTGSSIRSLYSCIGFGQVDLTGQP